MLEDGHEQRRCAAFTAQLAGDPYALDRVEEGGEGRPGDHDRARDRAQRSAHRTFREEAAHVDDHAQQAEREDHGGERQRAHRSVREASERHRAEQRDVLERTGERDAGQVQEPELTARGAPEQHTVDDAQHHEGGREDRCRSQWCESAAGHQLLGGVDSVPVV